MKKNSCSISCIEKMCRFIFLSAQFTHKNTLLFYAHKVDIVFLWYESCALCAWPARRCQIVHSLPHIFISRFGLDFDDGNSCPPPPPWWVGWLAAFTFKQSWGRPKLDSPIDIHITGATACEAPRRRSLTDPSCLPRRHLQHQISNPISSIVHSTVHWYLFLSMLLFQAATCFRFLEWTFNGIILKIEEYTLYTRQPNVLINSN